jgi:hypothetical protein
VFGQSLSRQSFVTTDNTAAVAVNKSANAAIIFTPFYLPGPMMVSHMVVDVTTALGATGDLGIYDANGNLLLNGGNGSLSAAAGLKNIAPTQTGNSRFLPPGQYYAAVTFNSTTGRLAGNTLAVAGLINRVGAIAAGGGTVLPASIVPANIVNTTDEFFFQMSP